MSSVSRMAEGFDHTPLAQIIPARYGKELAICYRNSLIFIGSNDEVGYKVGRASDDEDIDMVYKLQERIKSSIDRRRQRQAELEKGRGNQKK